MERPQGGSKESNMTSVRVFEWSFPEEESCSLVSGTQERNHPDNSPENLNEAALIIINSLFTFKAALLSTLTALTQSQTVFLFLSLLSANRPTNS